MRIMEEDQFLELTRDSLRLTKTKKVDDDEDDEDCVFGDSSPDLVDGVRLPKPLQKVMPKKMLARQLQDIDPYYRKQGRTFVVISGLCQHEIFRFSATKSLFLFSPFNWIRRVPVWITANPLFKLFMICTIITDCVLLALDKNPILEYSEPTFVGIYTFEYLVKIVARGFIYRSFTYLRNPFHWLDLALTILSYVTLATDDPCLRTWGILRAFKLFDLIPCLKVTLHELVLVLLNTVYVIVTFILALFVATLFGLELYMGVLTRKCVSTTKQDPTAFLLGEQQKTFGPLYVERERSICGNISYSALCPSGEFCLEGHGPNPQYGYTNFDSFGYALVSAFRIFTQDYWEVLYHLIIRAVGPWHMIYFVIVVLVGSYWCVNLIVIVVNSSYSDLRNATMEREEFERVTNVNDDECDDSITDSKEAILKQHRRFGWGDKKENSGKGCCFRCVDYLFLSWNCWGFKHLRGFIAFFVLDPFFGLFIALVVIVNIVFLALVHHKMSADLECVVRNGKYVFTAIFLAEVVLKFVALAPKKFFKCGWNILDVVLIAIALVEIGLEVEGCPVPVLRLFPLLRVFKLAPFWPTLNTILHFVSAVVCTLIKLVIFVAIIVVVFAVFGRDSFGSRYNNSQVTRWNFSDFFHSFMTLFRVICGEWLDPMWDCVRVSGWGCVPFFIIFVIVVNLFFLNVFVAVLLSVFVGSNKRIAVGCSSCGEDDKLGILCSRIRRLLACLTCSPRKGSARAIHPKMDRVEVDGVEIDIDGDIKLREISSRNEEEGSLADIKCLTIPSRCLPPFCYSSCCCSWCSSKTTPFWQSWGRMRQALFKVVTHWIFEFIMFLFILLACVSLVADDKWLNERPDLKDALIIIDCIFAAVIVAEMILKWCGIGFYKYFTDCWCLLQFCIVLVSLSHVGLICQEKYVSILKWVHSLRLLYPLYRFSILLRTQAVPCTVIKVIPEFLRMLFACIVFWLLFAIVGVHFFSGRFNICINTNSVRIVDFKDLNKTRCNALRGMRWMNDGNNFDDVGQAYVSLFHVASFRTWLEIVQNAIDSRFTPDLLKSSEFNIHSYFYFVIFIICGSFFAWYLFVAIVWAKYQEEKIKHSEMLSTEEQSRYWQTMKRVANKKPHMAIPKPTAKFPAFIHKVVNSQRFEVFMMFVLIANLIVVAVDHYDMSRSFAEVFDIIIMVFIGIFVIEILLKLVVQQCLFFLYPWNYFDVILVILSIVSVTLRDDIGLWFPSPALFCLIRVVKMGHYTRFMQRALGLRVIVCTLWFALPEVATLCALLLVVMFIYAIFGMYLFRFKDGGALDGTFNFGTFGQSMVLMFQLSTSVGWDQILEPLMNEDNRFKLADGNYFFDGNCGNKAAALVFVLSYLAVTYLIIMNLFLAILGDTYRRLVQDVQEGVTDDILDMFYFYWQKYDPVATRYIRYDQLSDFLAELEAPLKIEKPNKYKIVSLEIPICRGDRVYCTDVLSVVTDDFFCGRGELDTERGSRAIVDKGRPDYQVVSTTLWRQRENYGARIIQRAWRQYRGSTIPAAGAAMEAVPLIDEVTEDAELQEVESQVASVVESNPPDEPEVVDVDTQEPEVVDAETQEPETADAETQEEEPAPEPDVEPEAPPEPDIEDVEEDEPPPPPPPEPKPEVKPPQVKRRPPQVKPPPPPPPKPIQVKKSQKPEWRF